MVGFRIFASVQDRMSRSALVLAAALLIAACSRPPETAASGVGGGAVRSTPAADHHQHIFSPTLIQMVAPGAGRLDARDLVPLLDSATIPQALLLSAAYMFGSPDRTVEDEYAKVRAENDWVSAEAAKYPDRLRAFCSFNPLEDYALDELARCARDPHLRRGIKLHFGNSDVQLDAAAHLDRLRGVFEAANGNRMAVVVHLRANISKGRPYGAAQARVFLEDLLPLVPDVPVQVAHLAGTGPGYDDPPADSALAFLAEAVASGDPRTRRLLFDIAGVVDTGISDANAATVARRIRRIGIDRILFGADAPVFENLRPRESWAAFRRIPLSDEEFRRIAGNVAPYLR
jgi:predicted TIM-barrel fold metal-dependent hydrolase